MSRFLLKNQNFRFNKKAWSNSPTTRFHNSEQPESIKKNIYFDFVQEIEKEFSTRNKDQCLIYLNNLYKHFQNMVQVQYFPNTWTNVFWNELLNPNEINQIKKSLVYVNNHKNFTDIKLFLSDNLSQFNEKEMALVVKMYGTIENNKNDSNSAKLIKSLNSYCLKNINSFDLNDFNNVSEVVTTKFKDTEFSNQSFTRVYEELMKSFDCKNLELIGIEKEHFGKFEGNMRGIDGQNNNYWLKLDIYRKYCKLFKLEWCKLIIESIFNTSIRNLSGIECMEYKVNFLVSLLHSSRLHVSSTGDLCKVDLSEILKKIEIDSFIVNLDLVEYKQDLIKAFTVLLNNRLIEPGNLDYLLNFYASKLRSDSITKVEYFAYLDIFFKLGAKKSIDNFEFAEFKRKHKKERSMGSKSKILRVKYFLSNINQDLKQKISKKFNKFIIDFDPLCLLESSNGFFIIHCVHSNSRIALKLFYEKLIELLKVDMFGQKIMPIIPLLAILSENSTKNFELKLCDYLMNSKQTVESSYNVLNLVQFIMLNHETLGENFYFTLKSIKDNLCLNFSSFELSSVYYLFDRKFDVFIQYDKTKALSLLNILYTKIINELNSDELIINFDVMLLCNNLIKKVNSYYYKNLISIDELNQVFNSISNLNLKNTTEDDIKDIWYTKSKLIAGINSKYRFATIFISTSRYFSIENLDKFWLFLNTFLQFDLNCKVSCTEPNIRSFIDVLKIYETFDYTNSQMYKKEKEIFKELISQFYQRYKVYFNSDLNIFLCFVSSLLNLDCYIAEPFIEFFMNSSSLSLNTAETRLRLSNITNYLAEKNPNHKSFQEIIEYQGRVNNKFQLDFEIFFQNFMVKKYGIKEYNNRDVQMLITIDEKSHKLISPYSQNLKKSIKINLLDKSYYYQDSSILLNDISNHIKLSKYKKIIVEEEEFYKNNNRYDTLFESKIKKMVDTSN